MTEVEWLTATDPTRMLRFLGGRASDRKFRLFACACCRFRPAYAPANFRAVRAAEDFADGLIKPSTLRNAGYGPANWLPSPSVAPSDEAARCAEDCATAHSLTGSPRNAPGDVITGYMPRKVVRANQAALVRDVFGNPFRPVEVSQSWVTSTVRGVAEGIYKERAFDRLPILADALMDAGCDHPDVLAHCRGDGRGIGGNLWEVPTTKPPRTPAGAGSSISSRAERRSGHLGALTTHPSGPSQLRGKSSPTTFPPATASSSASVSGRTSFS